jgi:hypothetical protein
MFQMMGVFAEFERSVIQERVRAGKMLGRPRIAPELEARILAALKAPGRTEGVRKIAARFGISAKMVQRNHRSQSKCDAGEYLAEPRGVELFALAPNLAKHLCGLLARHEASGGRFSVFHYILVGAADEAVVAEDYRLSYPILDCGIVADDIGGSGYPYGGLRLP